MPAAKQYVALHDFSLEDEKAWKFTAGDDYNGPPEFIPGLLTNKYDINKGPLIAEKTSTAATPASEGN